MQGKIRLKASTLLMPCEREIDAEVFIHLKGYARARVSHLDVEKIGLGKVIRRGRGNFLKVRGVENGLEVVLKEECPIILNGKEYIVSSIIIACPLLNAILSKDLSTRAWVGKKYDGIYIGFKRREMKKLEKVALKEFGMKPLKKLEAKPKW